MTNPQQMMEDQEVAAVAARLTPEQEANIAFTVWWFRGKFIDFRDRDHEAFKAGYLAAAAHLQREAQP